MKLRFHIILFVCCFCSIILPAQDSTNILQPIHVEGTKKRKNFTAISPTQTLEKKMLDGLNAPSVGEAARFFSGVQVKDYGGVGGLKTISVRSLGSSQTGILYDGLPIADVQSGQTDLSRFSTNQLHSMELYNAHPPTLLLPARAYAAASVLAMYTPSYSPASARNHWQAAVRQGSFGYWQGFASVNRLLPGKTAMGLTAEAVTSKGDYPFTVNNGNLSEKTRRGNGHLRSLQGEINISKKFKDSATLQLKGWGFQSIRGLPGAVTFFNNRSVQSLLNNDYFAQLRYQRSLFSKTSLLVSGKFNHSYTRYRDPDFLNNAGGLDDRYKQNESFGSIAVKQLITKRISGSMAIDAAHTVLRSDKFSNHPTRVSTWGNTALSYADSLWQAQGSLLWTAFTDQTPGDTKSSGNKLTPSLALSRKISRHTPLMVRLFYKQVYRMPTFNDLYYNFIGNTRLRPELTRQHNLGLTYPLIARYNNHVSISIDGYINRITDKIVAVPSQNLFSWTMLNLGSVHIKGLDVTAEANGRINEQWAWTGRLSYTWQQAKDITDPASERYKDRIPYAPDHSGSAILSFGFQQWTAGYNLLFSGTRYTLGKNNPFNQLAGWSIHDIFVAHNFKLQSVSCSLKAELNNLTNQQYDIIRYYPMPGRTYKISIIIHQQ